MRQGLFLEGVPFGIGAIGVAMRRKPQLTKTPRLTYVGIVP